MSEHLPECAVAAARPGTFLSCICQALRACEARVRDDERSNNFTPDDHANGMTESYHRGFDDARWIAAKEALEGVQHENCDCGPCQAIHRALAELRTIGQD